MYSPAGSVPTVKVLSVHAMAGTVWVVMAIPHIGASIHGEGPLMLQGRPLTFPYQCDTSEFSGVRPASCPLNCFVRFANPMQGFRGSLLKLLYCPRVETASFINRKSRDQIHQFIDVPQFPKEIVV